MASQNFNICFPTTSVRRELKEVSTSDVVSVGKYIETCINEVGKEIVEAKINELGKEFRDKNPKIAELYSEFTWKLETGLSFQDQANQEKYENLKERDFMRFIQKNSWLLDKEANLQYKIFNEHKAKLEKFSLIHFSIPITVPVHSEKGEYKNGERYDKTYVWGKNLLVYFDFPGCVFPQVWLFECSQKPIRTTSLNASKRILCPGIQDLKTLNMEIFKVNFNKEDYQRINGFTINGPFVPFNGTILSNNGQEIPFTRYETLFHIHLLNIKKEIRYHEEYIRDEHGNMRTEQKPYPIYKITTEGKRFIDDRKYQLSFLWMTRMSNYEWRAEKIILKRPEKTSENELPETPEEDKFELPQI